MKSSSTAGLHPSVKPAATTTFALRTEASADTLEEARRSAQRIGMIAQLVADLSDVDKLELIARLANSVQFKRERDDKVAQLRRRNVLNFIEELSNSTLDKDRDKLPTHHHDEILFGWAQ